MYLFLCSSPSATSWRAFLLSGESRRSRLHMHCTWCSGTSQLMCDDIAVRFAAIVIASGNAIQESRAKMSTSPASGSLICIHVSSTQSGMMMASTFYITLIWDREFSITRNMRTRVLWLLIISKKWFRGNNQERRTHIVIERFVFEMRLQSVRAVMSDCVPPDVCCVVQLQVRTKCWLASGRANELGLVGFAKLAHRPLNFSCQRHKYSVADKT